MASEVLVLGAGMVGVSTALALQQRGRQVVLVDRRPPGRETSYGNAGFIQREAVQPYAFPRSWQALWRVATGQGNDVHVHWTAMPALAGRLLRYWQASAPTPYANTCAAYARLIAHCIAEHEPLIAAAGAQDLVRKDGWLQFYRKPALFDAAFRDAARVAQAHGLDCAALDGAQLIALEPALRETLAGAIHWRDPWTISDPGTLVERYAALFVQRGGRIAQGDADSLRQTGLGWSVQTVDGALEAESAVLALGPWAEAHTRRLGYRLPLFVKRGYHRHYQGGAELRRPMLDTDYGVVLTPMQRGLRLTTGAEFAAPGAPATPVQLQVAERAADRLLGLGQPVEAQPWLGARPCCADMLPIIGPAPRHQGLWFHFGHGHQGFTLGPASARLLAERLCGQTPYVDPTPYDPARFR
ncbi:FAD-dependent oxidoreductase [Acidovorax sp. CCYZU-2555]|uniref:NAD(P)/FAD-dependent oxidoreductase n=1 Tax=Acidovorax sp. CCYZU-2555 TaxID=2835042 RepID=UPI001BCE7A26|nr:FAD-dependent oxidoreductase [Acidovorax sp. CCYZU-2555]MBS7780088.1 FAD-binding oxidoreductase [Acidovorax sp. CCYZU-2555]